MWALVKRVRVVLVPLLHRLHWRRALERLTGVNRREVLPWATLPVRMYYDCQAKVDALRAAWPK